MKYFRLNSHRSTILIGSLQRATIHLNPAELHIELSPGVALSFDAVAKGYIVDAALKHNQEHNIAIQESVVANAEVMARRGEYLPKVGFGAGTGVCLRVRHICELSS